MNWFSGENLKFKRAVFSRSSTAVLFAITLNGCSWLAGPDDEYIGDTLSDLKPAVLPKSGEEVPKVSLEEIEESYRRALDIAENDEVRRNILVRLAGLQMLRSEQTQLDVAGDEKYFDDPIAMYKELIDLQKGRPGRDKLIYQLAKAYALDGRSQESQATLDQLAREYPNSPYIAEAQFRRAERAFNTGEYAKAEEYYQSVVNSEEETSFSENAVYMLGWSQFKRNEYEESLVSFTKVLDVIMGESDDLNTVPGPKQTLVNDTFRVMSLVFSYLDGPKSIKETYDLTAIRSYNHLLYKNLGALYLEKKRFRDSADTFAYFVKQHPASDYAPEFSVQIIDVYDKGNFPTLLLPAKEDFINNYGIRSEYWAQKPESVRDNLKPYLHTYLEELGKYEHAQAQGLKNPEDKTLKQSTLQQMREQAAVSYEKAARWYEEFAETFPNDEKTPNIVFLLGEAFYESGQLPKAVAAYEKVAYEYLDPTNGPEAGYSAILALEELASRATPEEKIKWQDHKTASSISFADYYPDDERASKVLAQAAQSLLAKGENQQAVAAATRLTNWTSPLDQNLLRTAWLIVGQGQFDLERYVESEFAYRQVLSLMPAEGSPQLASIEGPTRNEVMERIAASMFKQADASLATNDKAAAVDQLLRVSELAPGTEIASKAEYDAATYLMDLERWQDAERVLVSFRQNYPTSELINTLPAKLVVIYQELEEWQLAASELSIMANNNTDPDVRRQSRFLAAELFEKSGDIENALISYRDYANNYRQPLAQAIEAEYKLAQLYEEKRDNRNRSIWLDRLIASDANAGSERSDRTKYLAAMASSEFADGLYQNFTNIPLTLPLKSSLDKKRKALDQTLKAYEAILEYGIAEYTTLASYRIGEVYVQLSQALMDSEKPQNLDALALEQYIILLEEQAFPFEERAIDIHEANIQRTREGIYDNWVKDSFKTLGKLLPARYNKIEDVIEYTDAIH
ncbi:MAG: tetratricopeptide repeat protein [Cellvibrionaceae bacterium]